MRRSLVIAVLLAAIGSRPVAALAPPESEAVTRARALYKAGQEALAEKRDADACRDFRESLELLRSPGTFLYVGSCWEREADPLAALESYEDAVRAAVEHPTAAEAQRKAWIQEARRRIAAQLKRIAEVVIVPLETPGLDLKLDGKRVDVRWTSVRVNPGEHVLVASAPGHREHTQTLNVAAGDRKEVVIPRLVPAEFAAAEPPPVEPAPPVEAPQEEVASVAATEGSTPLLPWVLFGAGSAGVAAGIVTGIITMGRERELSQNCPDGDCPDDSWQSKIDGAKQTALITNVLWGVGLASAAVGVTLLVLDSSSEEGSAEAHLGCGEAYCGARLTGTF